jgi:hypothetical protein
VVYFVGLVLHLLFLVVPMVVLVSVSTLFYFNMKRVIHNLKKKHADVGDIMYVLMET